MDFVTWVFALTIFCLLCLIVRHLWRLFKPKRMRNDWDGPGPDGDLSQLYQEIDEFLSGSGMSDQ